MCVRERGGSLFSQCCSISPRLFFFVSVHARFPFLCVSRSSLLSLSPFIGLVSLASLAAHLSEVGTAAELELQHQWAICHLVYIFAL